MKRKGGRGEGKAGPRGRSEGGEREKEREERVVVEVGTVCLKLCVVGDKGCGNDRETYRLVMLMERKRDDQIIIAVQPLGSTHTSPSGKRY